MRWIAEDGRVTVDDVPVFWHEGPPPFRAGLVFGVGRRDESFVRGGTTHLVEHLTMRALGRTTLDCNASVDVLVTEFVAAGRPERVVGFLRRVCEILADLPTEGLRIEVDVLSAEDGRVTQPVFGQLLGEAYGGYGAGLAAYLEPALRAVTAGEIHAWADRFFTRANAALWLTGPVPDGLTLPLPGGESPARSAQRRRALSTPAWSQHPFNGHIGIGAHVPRAAGLGAACRILRDRVEDNLRHTRGLSYSVDIDDIPIDMGNRFAAVLADVREGQEATAARALWNELDALAATGPTEAELNHDREGFSEFLIDPRSVGEEVRAAASAHVTSLPFRSLEQQRSEAETVTPEDIRAAAAAFRSNAILSVPEPVELSLPGVVRLAEWSPDVVSGRTFRRRIWSGAPRGARLVLGDDGISALLGGAQQITVRYSDVIGLVEIGPDEYELLSGEGFSIPLSRRDWGGGADVIAAVRAAVPADLQVRGDPQDAEGIEGTTVLLLRAPGHVAREAVWPTKRDAWVLPGHQWSLVVFAGDHGKHPYEDAGEVSAWLGRRRAVLVLSQTHDELSYVLMRGGKA